MDREYVQPGVGCQLCVVRVTGKRQRRILATGNSDGVDGDRRGHGVAGPTDRRIERGARAMKHPICLITGATEGVGKVTALELAKKGFTIVIAARNADKAGALIEQIEAS